MSRHAVGSLSPKSPLLQLSGSMYPCPMHVASADWRLGSSTRAKLYIALARMFRTLDLELWDTVRERDIDHT